VLDSSVTAGVVEETLPTSIENGSTVAETGRSKRKRVARRHVLNTLNGCLCGEVVDSLRSPSNTIVKCKEMGCETEWVISDHLYSIVAYRTHFLL
jgi:hypothetical protein